MTPNLPLRQGQQGHEERRVLRGDHNQCARCREYFNSGAAFDKHRTGRFGVDRRCRTAAEMLKAGMVVSVTGWWLSSAYKYPDSSVISDSGSAPDGPADTGIPTEGSQCVL